MLCIQRSGLSDRRFTIAALLLVGAAILSTDVLAATRINFQPASAAVPAGYVADSGQVFGDRGGGLRFGWSASNTSATRDRNSSLSPDQRHDTLIHTQMDGNKTWEFAAPNGRYSVRLVAGDAAYTNSHYKFTVEGEPAIDAVPTSSRRWIDRTLQVIVSDGRLTVANSLGASNNKLCFIEIESLGAAASVFAEEFTGTSLSPTWTASPSIKLVNGHAVSIQSSTLDKTTPLAVGSYILETRVRGFFGQSGSPSNSHQLVVNNADGHFYRVMIFQDGTLSLYKDFASLATTTHAFTAASYVKLKIVRDQRTSAIQVWVDSGSGYGTAPALRAYDGAFPQLASFGWWRDSEAPDYDFGVDWVRVSRVP